MTSTFVIIVRIRGGDDRTEITTSAGSLKDAKYIRDSYRAAGLEANILIRNVEVCRYLEDD